MLKKFLIFLDNTTMYRLTLVCLFLISIFSLFFSFFGLIYYPIFNLFFSLGVILLSCVFFHYLFSFLKKAPSNIESTLISAFLIFLIFDPFFNSEGLFSLVLISFLTIASKYLIVYRKNHFINPVIFGAVLISLLGLNYATWWVANPYLFLPVLILGFLLIYKIRKIEMAVTFILSSFIFSFLVLFFENSLDFSFFYTFFLAWPILFFSFFMLTEPIGIPSERKNQIFYAILVGALSSVSFSFLFFNSSFEMSLFLANLLFFFFFQKSGKFILKLKEIKKVSENSFLYIFSRPKNLNFKAGQYLEAVLPHKEQDSRGVSRYFSLASSPTEKDLAFLIKMENKKSSFKEKLKNMKKEDILFAKNISGDFILKKNEKKEIVFVAGGVGITPFFSMIKYIIDKKQESQIKLFLCAQNHNSITNISLLKKWQKENKNLKIIYVLDEKTDLLNCKKGRLNKKILDEENVSFKDSIFYISGPTAMVKSVESLLRNSQTPKENIKTDYFPGFS